MKITYFVKIFLPLLLICACVAGLVSGIHLLTAESIAANEAGVAEKIEAQKLKMISEI